MSFIYIFTLSCGKANKEIKIDETKMNNLFNTFDQEIHLKPNMSKAIFDTIHSWDFGWAILEPINIAETKEDEIKLAKSFSPGQKALYFFWYLDAQVTNGGFIQFYWNDYRLYIPAIKEGLKLIGDEELLSLINEVDKYYVLNKNLFDKNKELEDWEPLYENLIEFDQYDDMYYKIHDNTMNLLEKYIRTNPSEFINLIK